jgi:hypothetical protein
MMELLVPLGQRISTTHEMISNTPSRENDGPIGPIGPTDYYRTYNDFELTFWGNDGPIGPTD